MDDTMSQNRTHVSGTNEHDSSCQFFFNNRLCKDVILYANSFETPQSDLCSGILVSRNTVLPKPAEPSECYGVLNENDKKSLLMCSSVLEDCNNDEGKGKTVGPANRISSESWCTTTRFSSNSTMPLKQMPPSTASRDIDGGSCMKETPYDKNTCVIVLDQEKNDLGSSYSEPMQADNFPEDGKNLPKNQEKIKTKDTVSQDKNKKRDNVEKTKKNTEEMSNVSRSLKKKTSRQDTSEDSPTKKPSCGPFRKPSINEEKAEKKHEQEMNFSQKKFRVRRKMLWRPRHISEEELQRRETARIKRKENNFREREAYIQRYTDQLSVLKERLESTKRSDLILIEASPRRSTREEKQTDTEPDCALKEKEAKESEKTKKDNNVPQETSKSSSTCETTTTCYEEIFTCQGEDDVAFDEYIERNCFL